MIQSISVTRAGCRPTSSRHLPRRWARLAMATIVVAAFVSHRFLARTADAAPATRPNIILIMADDMGYGDSSVYQGWIKTPNMERMARDGLMFTDFHSSGAVCSPTRAGLMTGRYQQRAGVPGVVNADPKHADHHRGLQTSEATFAKMLRKRGYRTGMFGKWHLGYTTQYNPLHHGFDEFRGFVSGNIDYVSHYDRMETHDWWHGDKRVHEEGYLTELITGHAVDFIARHKDQPFCLYVPHGAVHSPIQGPESPAVRGPMKQRIKKNAETQKETVRQMMKSLDDSIGAILDAVERNGISDRTLIVFFSDNGGAAHMSCDPLRGKKVTVWEGGHRVPAIAVWPKKIRAGSVSKQLCISLDLMPTMLQLAGASEDVDAERRLDGVSLAAHMIEQDAIGRRKLFWQHGANVAMRDGDWKLVAKAKGLRGGPALYDLSNDLSETTDLADSQPRRVAQMMGEIDAWQKDVAQDVTRQPTYDSFRRKLDKQTNR